MAILLRPGKTPSGHEVRCHLRRLVRRIRKHWPRTRLTIRGDGHFGRPEVIAWCEANATDYIFGLPGNAVLSRLVEPAADDVRVRHAETYAHAEAHEQAQTISRYTEACYAAKSWTRQRRMAVRGGKPIRVKAHGKEYLSGRRRAVLRPRLGTRTALYLRVSIADQKPDLQYDGLRAYAERAGLDVVQDYCDVAVSGRRGGRPQFNALMMAARNQEIDCVLVWKFDRFARSTRHLFTALEEFDHLGVRFVSVQDQVDTESPMGRVMFTIIGAMADLQSSLISERVTAGMRTAQARGRHLGRPTTSQRVVSEIETLATSADLSIRDIQKKIAGRASRGIVGEITKRARARQLQAL